MFKLRSEYKPTGDQPQAIESLVQGVNSGKEHQVLMGVTGSGKTFTIANVIEKVQKPTLVISHNKTLAAQLYQEFRDYFPQNAVEYFVSYYDYFQPESYIPSTDTYIEKDSDINDEIDKLRLSATTSLMTRKDVIVVASVSCIYNLGSPTEYSKVALSLKKGMKIRREDLFTRLTQIYYERNDFDFKRGAFRVRGDIVDIFPAYQDYALRLEIFNNTLTTLEPFDPLTGDLLNNSFGAFNSLAPDGMATIYPAKHYITDEDRRNSAFSQILQDLEKQVDLLRKQGKSLEAYRLEQRTKYDLEMIREVGYCKGIENYSRYFDGRNPGDPPYTLLDFFPKDYLVVVDESHITIPQIRGMHNGDKSRKETLIQYGFRLPSALDNRPLNFLEYQTKVNQVIYTSATPSEWEIDQAQGSVVEQIIRPTGIVDPKVLVLPTKNQIADLMEKVRERISRGERVLITTLTKRMAEELASFLRDKGIKTAYLHSDIDTLERTDILDNLRLGKFDVLVGINLLREGLDLPEVSLVIILDADKEGFLRSESSLIQVMGRAARHTLGEVVMYADTRTGSMVRAISEVERRRKIQMTYNLKHGINPQNIIKPIRKKLVDELVTSKKAEKVRKLEEIDYSQLPPDDIKLEINRLEEEMLYEAEVLNFEEAAYYRDKIRELKKLVK